MTDSVPVAGRSDETSAAVLRVRVASEALESAPVATTLLVPKSIAAAVGAYGERLAARYLVEYGMQVLDRNWRCDQGEIDIVALDGNCLVIVEVKTRRSLAFGSPVEAVTAVKACRLRRLAGCWLADHRTLVGSVADVRIDVIGILRPTRGPAQIEHLVAVTA